MQGAQCLAEHITATLMGMGTVPLPFKAKKAPAKSAAAQQDPVVAAATQQDLTAASNISQPSQEPVLEGPQKTPQETISKAASSATSPEGVAPAPHVQTAGPDPAEKEPDRAESSSATVSAYGAAPKPLREPLHEQDALAMLAEVAGASAPDMQMPKHLAEAELPAAGTVDSGPMEVDVARDNCDNDR